MFQNLNAKTKALLHAWWHNGRQADPVILGTSYSSPLPPVSDLEAYWNSNAVRFGLFKKRCSKAAYYGCAIPHHYVDFGSSAMAGALGCPMRPMSPDTVWPSPVFDSLPQPEEIRIRKQSLWYRNMHALTELSACDSSVSTTFYALGGICDTLGSMMGEQNLLMEMIDRPCDTHACLSAVCDIWIREKESLYTLISAHQEGMASWAGIWAPGSTFPVQDDISFMLSKDFYDDFCLPYIKKCINSLDYPLYHLDGPAALKHLDSILSIQNLRAIQWVPGAGHLDIAPWYPLVEKILASGRSVQLFCRAEEVAPLVKRVGAKGLLLSLFDATPEHMNQLEKYL